MKIYHEYVVCIRNFTTSFEQFFQIIKLQKRSYFKLVKCLNPNCTSRILAFLAMMKKYIYGAYFLKIL